MAISSDDVRHVARLARLELTDAEVELFVEQLDSILSRAERIQSLDLDEVPPTAHPVATTDVLRPDVVVEPADNEAILSNAPEREGDRFRVPRILE